MHNRRQLCRTALAVVLARQAQGTVSAQGFVRVSPDQKGFVVEPGGQKFTPWGVNYDHDENGRLIEDYWHDQWAEIVEDFREIKALGANVVRIHLQFGKFMDSAETANKKNLDQLSKLVELAEKMGLYLNLTGLGCYHKVDVPAWYDALDEKPRWAAQAAFWRAIAERCKNSNAIFCYDLMNEPVVPGGKRKAGDWLGPPFAGKHFVQVVTLDQANRPRPEIAREWTTFLAGEIRKVDANHLITIGLVDWSLDRPGLTSGFVPDKIAGPLDFLCVHIYPEKDKNADALKTLAGFQIGKPVVIEETFALKCDTRQWRHFIDQSRPNATGWFGFYWGKTPAELKQGKTIADGIVRAWLEEFQKGPPK